ncbi:Anaphase promoting complex subunit 7 [Coemansia linderi]|uniref:Anaphase promoting complex subunit 7 n=1 Tax=Coemansia linderi TaxID=2663919 RepID=A0ACC1KB55_9FUNG|nr:Anaphase promoting complex subunit 7 [Coemansia linderi]
MSLLAVVDEITELIACDLGEAALSLAELECRPRLADPAYPAAERLCLARALASSLRAVSQHRAALRATADFVSAARGQLAPADVEAAARDMADMRWALGEADLCLAQLRQIPRAHRTRRDWARMARCADALGCADAAELRAHAPPPASEAAAAAARVTALMQRLDYGAAAAELSRLARRGPGSPRLVALLAACRFHLGDDRAARGLFARAAAGGALFDEAGAHAALLMRAGDRLAVYALGRRLLRADAGRAEGWVAMARFLAMAGRAQDALAVAWKAQALAPRLADAFLAEGAAQMAAGNAGDAAAALLRAHALAPSAFSYAEAVAALVRAERLKDAFVYARELAELMPGHPAALALVGSVLAHSPESAAKAEALLAAALAADRRCAAAVDALAALFVAGGRVSDARALLEAHLPELPTDAMYARYADVLTLANDLPAAAANYAAALDLNQDNQRARAGYERVGRLMQPGAENDDDDDDEQLPIESDFSDAL